MSNTSDYCDGIEGMLSASTGGLSEGLLAEVFCARTDAMDTDSRQRVRGVDALAAVLARLRREGRAVLVDMAGARWWCTPRQARALRAARVVA